jgi:ABC-2 type transport system ATP-binding protein
MKDEVLELKTEKPQDLMEPFGKVSGVKEVALFGRGLHLVVEDYHKVKPALDQILQQFGIQKEKLKQIEPSLEDVFVSLIEAREERDSVQKEVRQ